MQATQQFSFDRYRMDLAAEQLWRGSRSLPLTSKAFAVLRYLVEHAGQVVSKAELFAALWPGTAVTDGALTVCIKEVRKALGDKATAPRFIATVHRRGYRFLPAVTTSQGSGARDQGPASFSPPAPGLRPPASVLVGRETELVQLHSWLDEALDGRRQIVFVTGEPGIGKTTLLEVFVSGIYRPRRKATGEGQQAKFTAPRPLAPGLIFPDPRPLTPNPWFARGQCIEQHGSGEAFLPVLDALGRLACGTGGARLIEILRIYAPMWLVQLPAFIDGEELESLQRKVQGASRERMLREFADLVEALTTGGAPLLLVLEDLHWSDASTLDLLAFLARRKEAARLLVIGTYRPVEMLNDGHPLQDITQELYAHGLGVELPLGLLSEEAILQYLTARLSVPSPFKGESQGEGNEAILRQTLAHILHQRTDGNPLFLVSLVNDLIERGLLVQTATGGELQEDAAALESTIPDSIRYLVARQSGRLSFEERHTLEAASAAGMEFSAAAVAAALTTETVEIERQCEQLAERQHFLRRGGIEEWPDGTLAAHYVFLHALYQHLWHERVSPTQLQHYHLQIGERKEQACGARAREIATELAIHFEQGRDYPKAVQYLQQAGERAVRCSAHQEAVALLTKGLELLNTLPDTPERTWQELSLQYTLGTALLVTKGTTAPEIARVYTRTQALCQQVGTTPPVFWVQLRLWKTSFHHPGGRTPREHAEQLLPLPYKGRDLTARLPPSLIRGVTLFFLGELVPARVQLEEGITLYVPQQHRSVFHGIACLAHAAQTLWALGYPDQALTRSDEALTLALEARQPYSQAFARHWAAGMYCLRGEIPEVHAHAAALLSLSTQKGLVEWRAIGALWRGWVLAAQGKGVEGMAQVDQGLASRRALGAELWWTYYLTLAAEASGKAGQVEEGLSLLAEALTIVDTTGECFYEAELYRLKGELILQQCKVQGSKFKVENPQSAFYNLQSEADACFLKAIEIARKQSARSWELRATMSLVCLRREQAKQEAPRTTQHATRKRLNEAHKRLAEVYNWFTEGFDTKDMQEAKALLETLGE